MKRRIGLALLVTATLFLPLGLIRRTFAEREENRGMVSSGIQSPAGSILIQEPGRRHRETNSTILKALGINQHSDNVSAGDGGRMMQQSKGDADRQFTVTRSNKSLRISASGTGKRLQPSSIKRLEAAAKGGTALASTGLPDLLDDNSALSAALMTTMADLSSSTISQVNLLADWDGREDMTADRSALISDFLATPLAKPTRSAISEHTRANGHPFFNAYYYGDSLGNMHLGIDTSGNSVVDVSFTINVAQLINTGTSGGFTLLNPTGSDCADPQAVITGIAVNPVADLGDFDAAQCGTVGEVIYFSTLETTGCAMNVFGERIRTRIFAVGLFEGSDAMGGFIQFTDVRQLAQTSLENTAGLAVDDDGSLYFSLVDFDSVSPATGVGGMGGAIFKATELPRSVCSSVGFNRTIPTIPGLLGSSSSILGGPLPVIGGGVRLTNYSGPSPVFGNVASLTTGPKNVVYAAVAASNTGIADPTQGLFRAPDEFTGGLPSMVITLADAVGSFDTCSSPAPGIPGAIPVGNGVADPAGPGTSIRWRAFVLGNGPDVRTSTAPLSNVTGTTQNTLKLAMQVDHTINSGIAVNEEGTVFVISGGTPAGAANNPSPALSEILGFEDKQPGDRRADYVDFRADGVPAPPASGGNVGDGDSDRFDHIYFQAPTDPMTSTPVGLSGLARGFLRYTNRLVGTNAAALPLGTGINLGATETVQSDDDTDGPINFESLDPGHQVAGGDDQNNPFRGDDNDGAGNPALTGALNGGFEFSFGGSSPMAIWNAFFLNSNGSITFQAGDTDNIPAVTELRSNLPKIAPAWADLNPAARSVNPINFPVQALGFAGVNAFKVRWINVGEFGNEGCTLNASNTFSVTLYDDGTARDENENQILDPADPTGDNLDPAFDEQEGPTDLRHVPPPITGASVIGDHPRSPGSGNIAFEYGRVDLLGTASSPVITGYSIGALSSLNPPGTCEDDLSERAAAADTGFFGILPGSNIASVLPSLIGEGTEQTVYEVFDSGVQGSIGSEGHIILSIPDFDLRFEGNDATASTPAAQADFNRDRVGLYGTANAPPANPVILEIIAIPTAFTPNAGTDLLDALGEVEVFVVGRGFFPNEATIICQGGEGGSVPVQRPGKTVSSAMAYSIDNNGDSISDATIALGNVTPISRNLARARFVPLFSAPGTAFPFAAATGSGIVTTTTTFTAGDNNVFGPFTRAAVGTLSPGLRAPIVFGITKTTENCSVLQNLTVSGANFLAAGPVTSVFAVEEGNPGNVINATSFAVLNNNLINAIFNFGGAPAGKSFLIFVSGPGGTSRNIIPTLPPGTPAGVPLGNEQGNIIKFVCVSETSAANTLVFGAASVDASEGCATANVTVNRINPTGGTVTVDYTTSDGSATQKSDYGIVSGTLTFGPDETMKVIVIPVNEDSFVEGNETFNVMLSNATGGAVAGVPSIVTIVDDDMSPPTSNPIDEASNFVCQQYHDFLNRQPDPAGLAFWTNEITSCGADAACIDVKRQNVSAAFFLSIEFQETGFGAIRTQRVAFGRKSDTAALRLPYAQFMRDAQQIGNGVIFGQPGAAALLEQNKQAYATQIVNSGDFITRFALGLTAAQYVDALYTSAMVVPTTSERDAAIAAFGGGGTAGRVAALRNVADSNSVRQAEFNVAFVLMQYYGYLRRNPTDPPDADDTGYQFWLTKLNSFGGNFIQAELVKAFITSIEYRQRFGP